MHLHFSCVFVLQTCSLTIACISIQHVIAAECIIKIASSIRVPLFCVAYFIPFLLLAFIIFCILFLLRVVHLPIWLLAMFTLSFIVFYMHCKLQRLFPFLFIVVRRKRASENGNKFGICVLLNEYRLSGCGCE